MKKQVVLFFSLAVVLFSFTSCKKAIQEARENYEKEQAEKESREKAEIEAKKKADKENKERQKRLSLDKKIISESLEVYFADLHFATESQRL